MKAEIVNPFLHATVDVLRTMAGVEARRGAPRLKGAGEPSFDISGLVGLSGQVQGYVALSFREPAAFYVVGRFLGEPVQETNAQVRDAVGELANIVAGGAKRVLAEQGYDLKISIPTVVVGRNHTVSRPRGIPCIEIPFDTDGGPFRVELCLKLEP
ncbi:chemotaxis protein CheX [Deferrisoma camini]|uniref:chemotaxis protein CheX n=1 Tax=Deferrisoma camini TaxID=1035120 RepID=UPI00046D0847|nr:chemotaxis protein CheX [Deferrisoma camini]